MVIESRLTYDSGKKDDLVTRRFLDFLRDEDGETATPGNGYTHVAHVQLVFTSASSWRSLYQY
jgi:hypothetical protein